LEPLEGVALLVLGESGTQPDKSLLSYSGELGVGLQHVGSLVGRRAHQQLWPAILAWAAAALTPGGRDHQPDS
jgi:hypothetical protein